MTVVAAASPILGFQVEVASVVRLSPSYLRITFAGDALAHFHDGGPDGTRDLRVKVVIPSAGHEPPELDDLSAGWYPRWLALDPEVRGCMRTYTVRRTRLAGPRPEIDIDFVLHLDEHGHGGPATTWAANARLGDRVTIIGPNADAGGYGGIEWQPPVPRRGRPVRVLLAGDETAVPAIGAILEGLPAGYTGHAVLEVPSSADFQPLLSSADVEVTWLARGAREHGEPLRRAVRDLLQRAPMDVRPRSRRELALPEVDVDSEILWETTAGAGPDDRRFYAWIAGEAATVRDLRRLLVRDLGVDRADVAFMGYWRQGRAEGC